MARPQRIRLGDLLIQESLLTAEQLDQPEPRFPLDVAFCEACALVQITEEVPPEMLFVDNYLCEYRDYRNRDPKCVQGSTHGILKDISQFALSGCDAAIQREFVDLQRSHFRTDKLSSRLWPVAVGDHDLMPLGNQFCNVPAGDVGIFHLLFHRAALSGPDK